MRSSSHTELGKKGEALAEKHLVKQGYQILERNWRSGKQEIDIICKKENLLVVVEVKTRFTDEYGEPETAVTKRKQKHLIKAAHDYVLEKDLDVETRFDVISIILNQYRSELDHIEDAFSPIW